MGGGKAAGGAVYRTVGRTVWQGEKGAAGIAGAWQDVRCGLLTVLWRNCRGEGTDRL